MHMAQAHMDTDMHMDMHMDTPHIHVQMPCEEEEFAFPMASTQSFVPSQSRHRQTSTAAPEHCRTMETPGQEVQADSQAPKIGLIGLGKEGLKIAEDLAARGCAVAAYDANPSRVLMLQPFLHKGIAIMASAQGILEYCCTLVLVAVPEASLKAVLTDLALAAQSKQGQEVLFCSNGFTSVSELTADLEPDSVHKCCGLRFIDAGTQSSMAVGDFSLLNETHRRLVLKVLSDIELHVIDKNCHVHRNLSKRDDVKAFVALLSPDVCKLGLDFSNHRDGFRVFANAITSSARYCPMGGKFTWSSFFCFIKRKCGGHNASHHVERARTLSQLAELRLSFKHLPFVVALGNT